MWSRDEETCSLASKTTQIERSHTEQIRLRRLFPVKIVSSLSEDLSVELSFRAGNCAVTVGLGSSRFLPNCVTVAGETRHPGPVFADGKNSPIPGDTQNRGLQRWLHSVVLRNVLSLCVGG